MDPIPDQQVPHSPTSNYPYSTLIILTCVTILLIATSSFLAYQNMQLQKQVNILQGNSITPTPTAHEVTCQHKGRIYQNGDGFKDKCNSCSCVSGQVACTLMACEDDSEIRSSPNPSLYTCPKYGYVDCEPGPNAGVKYECTPEAFTWFKANCPDFMGGAL